MLTIQSIRSAARDIASLFDLDKVTLFGSYARGEADEQSDVDLVIENTKPLGFRRAEVYRELEQRLGTGVDIVFGCKNLYPFIREEYDHDAVVLYERA